MKKQKLDLTGQKAREEFVRQVHSIKLSEEVTATCKKIKAKIAETSQKVERDIFGASYFPLDVKDFESVSKETYAELKEKGFISFYVSGVDFIVREPFRIKFLS